MIRWDLSLMRSLLLMYCLNCLDDVGYGEVGDDLSVL